MKKYLYESSIELPYTGWIQRCICCNNTTTSLLYYKKINNLEFYSYCCNKCIKFKYHEKKEYQLICDSLIKKKYKLL